MINNETDSYIDLGMEAKLIDIATSKLLEKFGAGNHKPGSGSASAFQGMLSAQMMKTVIDLTNEPKRRKSYASHLDELLSIKSEIETKIYPRLEHLFQFDSELFDKVINLRIKRDNEQSIYKRKQYASEAEEALKVATDVPLEIAKLCLELGNYASKVFDYGFQSARGDSGVALSSARSGVTSCLFIVDLNILSLPCDEWMTVIREQRANTKANYEKLCAKEKERLTILESESEANYQFHQSMVDFCRGNLAESISSSSDIEQIARRLQNSLWLQRSVIWPNNTPKTPIQILKPDIVIKKALGYDYVKSDNLGIFEINGEKFQTAGLIDKTEKIVQVSKKFPIETQNFTAAHELGHAILHKQGILHRDRPIDGPTVAVKSLEETQADKFAVYFLLPSSTVVDYFEQIFGVSKFIMNENLLFKMGIRNVQNFRSKCRDLRGLSREIAKVEIYNGKSFKSLASSFCVSIETMAIRLEELELVEFH